MSGLPLFRGTFADPSAEKDREKSVTVEFACAHQPVPPPAVASVPFRPVVLEGMTVAPRGGLRPGEVDHMGNPCGGDVRAGAVTRTSTPAPAGRPVTPGSAGKVAAA